MTQKYIITIGYQKLVFESPETAMRVYALLTESTPITSASCYPNTPPDSLKPIDWVRDESSCEIELKRVDSSKFALHMTTEEYREKCKPRPTEVDGEARLIKEESEPRVLAAPTDDEMTF